MFKAHEKNKWMMSTELVFLLLFLTSGAQNVVVILKPDKFLENEFWGETFRSLLVASYFLLAARYF